MAVNKVVINQNGVENVLVDITDSTVTPNDMPNGVTAYDKSGNRIFGTLPNLSNVIVNGTQILHYIGDDGKYRLVLFGDSEDRGVLDVGSGVRVDCPVSSMLGDATPDDVSAAVFFTSAEGVNITGNLYPLDGVTVPESESHLTSLPNGELGVMLVGKPEERGILGLDSDVYTMHPLSSFGDVKASEVMYGKTFTSADGLRKTGTGGESIIKAENAVIGVRNASDTVGVAQAFLRTENGFVIRPDAVVEVEFPLSALGNATPEDVLAGKEFSSADGILRVGTFEPGPGSIEVTDDGNGNLTITNAVVTDNGGNINVTM